MNGYDRFADYYGYLTHGADYSVWSSYLKKLSGLSSFYRKNVLDLGCGSGEMLKAFYAEGASCHGVDMSAEMLSKADMKLYETRSRGGEYVLIHDDMASYLPKGKTFDFAYSACDSMNYLDAEQIVKLLSHMKSYMKKGSIFTFDMINPAGNFLMKETVHTPQGDMAIAREMNGNILSTSVVLPSGEVLSFTQYLYTEDEIRSLAGETLSCEICDFMERERKDPFCDKLEVLLTF